MGQEIECMGNSDNGKKDLLAWIQLHQDFSEAKEKAEGKDLINFCLDMECEAPKNAAEVQEWVDKLTDEQASAIVTEYLK